MTVWKVELTSCRANCWVSNALASIDAAWELYVCAVMNWEVALESALFD